MGIRNNLSNCLPLARVVGSNAGMLKVSLPVLRFLCGYMGKFQVREVGDNLILHSHLPPLNRALAMKVGELCVSRFG